MEDLQTYRARIGLFRHRPASKRNVPPHKLASCRQREQKRRQDRIKQQKSGRGSAPRLNPVANRGNMTSGFLRPVAIIVIVILLMASLTSGHMDTNQVFTEHALHTGCLESHVLGKCFTQALQQNYAIPSSMCDCLLGNAGVHAYNGNPRTPFSNDGTVKDREAKADTPSDDQLQPFPVGVGDVTSTIQQSQRVDKIQKLEIDIRKQHADMINNLNGYISPKLPETWEPFRNGLTPYLTEREIYGLDVTFVGQICNSLLRKDIIKYGEYDALLEVLDSVDVRAGHIVRRATSAIKDIKMKISALKPEARPSHKVHLTHREKEQTRFSNTILRESSAPDKKTMDVGKLEHMINQTKQWIKWKRQQTTFISTKAYNVAIDILKKTNLLLIKGNCGDGKSVLAIEIMDWLMGEREEQCGHVQYDSVHPRKKTLLLKELKTWDEIISCNSNLAIAIDDIFGYSSVYSEDLTWWKKITPFIRPVLDGNIGNDANCMILTVRNDVYEEHEHLFCYEDLFTKCVVDLSSSQTLQVEEKKNILRLYMPAGVELSTEDETTIVQSDLPFGFPECCRIFQSLVDMHDQPIEYFMKPLVHFKRAIRSSSNKSKQAALLFLVLAKGKVTISQLDAESSNAQEDELVKLAFNASYSGEDIHSSRTNTDNQTKRNVIKELESMIGTFVKLEHDTFTFYHDVVEDAVAILYGEITPKGFLQNANITYFSHIATSQGNGNALYIGDRYSTCLYRRILDELKTRDTKSYDLLTTLGIWDDANFVQNFFAWIRKQENVPNDFYIQWTINDVMPAIEKRFRIPSEDNDDNYSFFVFVAKSNKYYLLQHLIQQGGSNEIQMKLALDQACVAGSVKCALRLLESDITPDSVTLMSVVKQGSLKLLNKLISSGIDPNATTDDKTFDVENVNILQLACLYEKEQVALCLAQKFPKLVNHRDADGNSMFHHISMTNNYDLFKKVVTLPLLETVECMSLLSRDDKVTVLHTACRHQHIQCNGRKNEMCMYLNETYPSLITQRDDNGWHCLHHSAHSGDVDCFMYLVNLVSEGKSETESPVYVETLFTSVGETVLHLASLTGMKTMCTYLCQTYPSLISQRDNDGWHCLHHSAHSGDVDCFMYLDNLANCGKSGTERLHYMETLLSGEGETVLHLASLSGKTTMCTHLCQTYPSLLSQRDNEGRSCLHNAAQSGDFDCFVYLNDLANDGKSETESVEYLETLFTSEGETVLHRACLNGMTTMCWYLSQTYPSLLSQRDNDGWHCLHHAAHSGDVDFFKYLDNLTNDGKSETESAEYVETLLTSEGETVLHLASLTGTTAMCTYLCQTYPSLLSQRDNENKHCLHNAAVSGDVDCFKYLDNLTNDGKSETESAEYVETLLTSEGETVLHLASQTGTTAMCTYLCQTYPSLLSQRDNENKHCLHNAAVSGDVDCFMYLNNLTNDGKSETESAEYVETLLTSEGETVLHLASQTGTTAMCTYLCQTYPSLLSQRDNENKHCLHNAAVSGDVDCFMYLNNLTNDGKSETESAEYVETLLTSEGETVFHLASLNGNTPMCRYLCQTYPSLLSQRDNEGRSCLHDAAQSGDVDCFMYLNDLANDGKSETESLEDLETLFTSDGGENVLHLASLNGKTTMCWYLSQTYPSLLSKRDNDGWHCLHHAAHSGDVDFFKYLDNLTNDGKSETESAEYLETLLTSEGKTVLHLASLTGTTAMCTHLCQAYPSLLSQRDNEGRSCLHDAAHSGDVDFFKYLDNLTNDGKSETESAEYVETLLTSEGETVLHLASLTGTTAMCTYLCQTYPSLLSQRDNENKHCLHNAAVSGDVDCFMYLNNLTNDGKSETESAEYVETLLTSEGETVLHLASQTGTTAMCTYLCQTYPSLLSQRDNENKHCLHNAAVSGDVDCFMYLNNLTNDGKSETESAEYVETLLTSEGETVFHLASLNGNTPMCRYLCQTYPSLLSQRDNEGRSCLHDAAQSGDVDCFMYLDNLTNDGKSETESAEYLETLLTSEGETVLHLASLTGTTAMCTHLCQAYPSLLSQRDNEGRSCLHNAAVSGDVDCFKYLDNLTNDGKSETESAEYLETLLTSEGETVLHLASQTGTTTMCTHLCQTYPSLLSQRDNEGRSCLHHAAVSGDVDCFKCLDDLTNDGKSETESAEYLETLLTSEGETVLHRACLTGTTAMCTHLSKTYPSLLSQRDNEGRHCLHDAADSGDVDCFKYLDDLTNDGKSETESAEYLETLLTSEGETVLHRACLTGTTAMCTHLSKTYPSLLPQLDNEGRHCLHDAADSGDVDCFKCLDNLTNDGKTETERLHFMERLLTSKGETVFHRASLSGKTIMCTHLCQTYPSLLSQRDNDGWHCLHDAADSGDVDCFKYLDNLTNDGKTDTERLLYMERLLTSEGETVLSIASRNRTKSMYKHLCQAYPSLLSNRDNKSM